MFKLQTRLNSFYLFLVGLAENIFGELQYFSFCLEQECVGVFSTELSKPTGTVRFDGHERTYRKSERYTVQKQGHNLEVGKVGCWFTRSLAQCSVLVPLRLLHDLNLIIIEVSA